LQQKGKSKQRLEGPARASRGERDSTGGEEERERKRERGNKRTIMSIPLLPRAAFLRSNGGIAFGKGKSAGATDSY